MSSWRVTEGEGWWLKLGDIPLESKYKRNFIRCWTGLLFSHRSWIGLAMKQFVESFNGGLFDTLFKIQLAIEYCKVYRES